MQATEIHYGAPVGNDNGAKWTDEHTDALKIHVAAGLSFAQCAVELNTKFGTDYTRNAAIGRANRVGMQQPEGRRIKAVVSRIARKNKPRIRIISANGNSNHHRIIQSWEAAEVEALRCVEIVPRNLTLIELEPNDCRYPYGEGPYLFCGHPKRESSSYCGPHAALVLRRVLPEQTDAQRAAHRKVCRPAVLSLIREYAGEDAA